MAKLKGILKIQGTLDELTFYKSKNEHLVRTKGGIPKERIQNDPAFQRTRENGSEFGMAATAGKNLRLAIRNLLMNAKDNLVTSRLTRVMSQIKNKDASSNRGERHVSVGISTPEGKAILKGFNFNNKSILSSILFKPYSLDPVTGEVVMTGLVPINDIVAARGATHITMKSAMANVDFATGEFDTQISNEVNLPFDGSPSNVTLTPAAPAAGSGVNIYFLQIEFYQEVNGVQYSLKNGAYNSLAILEVN